MTCPFQNNTSLKKLPCNHIQHPHNTNIMFCTVCRDSFDIREVDSSFPSVLFFLLLGIIASLILTMNKMTLTDNPSNSHQRNLSIEANYKDTNYSISD